MSNMSHCRFENTLADLKECQEHVWSTTLSKEEHRARQQLIQVCREIAAEFEGYNIEELEND